MIKSILFTISFFIVAFTSCTSSNSSTKSTIANTTEQEEAVVEIEPIVTQEEPIAEELTETDKKQIETKTKVKKDKAQVPAESKTTNFLILQSTKSYSAAAYTSRMANEKLGLEINNRGYVFDFRAGLKDTAVCDCGELHGYIPRGRDGSSNYISIEHTNGFEEFEDGNYIVVAAVGKKIKLTPLLSSVREHFPDAYLKDAKVYQGCMH